MVLHWLMPSRTVNKGESLNWILQRYKHLGIYPINGRERLCKTQMCGKSNIYLFQIIQNEVLLDIDTRVFETSHRQALLWGNLYLLLQELAFTLL